VSEQRENGWVVGRVGAIPVVLSPGWLVAAVVLTALLMPFARRLAPGQAAVVVWSIALVLVFSLFGSTFLHEVAHAMVARHYAMPVRRIALTLLGGHTELGNRTPSPLASALVAGAGPATNLVLGALAWFVWLGLAQGSTLAALVLAFAVANGFVAALNLLPGLPLDGGRVLEALIWGMSGRRGTGTRVAAWAGRGLAVLIVVWALWPPLGSDSFMRVVWAALIATFVWSGANQALQNVGLEEALDLLELGALVRPVVTQESWAKVSVLGPLPTGTDVVLVEGPDPVGVVDPSAAAAVPAGLRTTTPLVAVATSLPPEARVDVSLTGRDAVDAVRRASAQSRLLFAMGANGQVAGLIDVTDVIRALHAPDRPETA
jgi:Zn-dependent protease